MAPETDAQITISKQDLDPDETLAIAYMTGGGARGNLIFGSLIFGATITRKHTTELFNKLSGASVGATISSTLNIPKSRGSTIPRYSEFDARDGFIQIIQNALPHGPLSVIYYPWQLLVDVACLFSEGFHFAVNWGVRKIDYGISRGLNFIGRMGHTAIRSKKPYNGIDIHALERIHDWTLNPVMDGWIRLCHHVAKISKYDINKLHKSLDACYRFEDTNEKVFLGETIVSHHITSMNATLDKPALFVNLKDINGTTIHTSDPNMELCDIATGSCAAQTIYDDHIAQNGHKYSDIAHADTVLSPSKTTEQFLSHKQRIVVFETGESEKEDLARMPFQLFLRQMMSSHGAPILRRITSFITKRDTRFLRQDWGLDNVTAFSIAVTRDTVRKKYADDPKTVRMAKILGFDLLERDQISETERLPSQNIFNTADRTMQQLDEWAWDVVWHNAEKHVRTYRWLLENAVKQGRVDAGEAKETLEDIEWLYPLDGPIPDTEAPPHRPFPNIKEELSKPRIKIDFGAPKTLSEHFNYFLSPETQTTNITVRHVTDEERAANDNKKPEQPCTRLQRLQKFMML